MSIVKSEPLIFAWQDTDDYAKPWVYMRADWTQPADYECREVENE